MAAPSPSANVNSSPLAAAQVAAYYGPQTQNALRRSQYLADALRQMSTQGGQNIRSAGELGAKLLATAILQRANDKGQTALLQALKGDQDAESTKYLGPLENALAPPMQTQPPPQSVPTPQPQAPQQAPAPPPPQAAPQPTSQQPQPAGLQVSPQDRDALVKMIATEARGEGPQGMAAAAHVALNRLKTGYDGAKSISDVVYQPHQFEGIAHAGQLRPEDLQAAGQVADQVLAGQVPDLTGGATHFLNPALQTQLGRQIPQWAQGQGQRIGNHVFFGGQPDVQMTAGQAPQGPLAVAPNMAQAQAAQPYQVASNGPTPPPSAPGSSPSAAGAPPAPPPQAPGAGGLPAEWPHWRPSKDEVAYVKGLLSDPRTHQNGVQEAMKMQEKMTQPVEATVQMVNGVPFYIAKDPTSGAPVMAIPVPREAMTQHFDGAGAGVPGAPAGTQFDVKPTGERSIAYQPPPGYQATPNGGLQYQQGGPADPTRPQTPAQGYQYSPQGQQPIAGGPADPKAPVNLLQGTQSIQKELRPTIDLAVVARQSYGAVQTGYQQQNGAGDIAMVNGLQHLIDKGVVRGEDVNMQMKANGLSGSVGSISQYLQSGGLLTPETRQRVLKTASELFKNVDATYRAQVMGYRQTVDNAYGQGAFDNYVMPHETASVLGWADAPQGPGGAPPPSPQPGPAAPSGPAGTQDAALAEAVRRKLQLSPAQQARARQLGLH